MLWCHCVAIIIQKRQEVYGNIREDEPNNTLANSESFKSKVKITGKTPDDGNTKIVEITVPLKYLSNF